MKKLCHVLISLSLSLSRNFSKQKREGFFIFWKGTDTHIYTMLRHSLHATTTTTPRQHTCTRFLFFLIIFIQKQRMIFFFFFFYKSEDGERLSWSMAIESLHAIFLKNGKRGRGGKPSKCIAFNFFFFHSGGARPHNKSTTFFFFQSGSFGFQLFCFW